MAIVGSLHARVAITAMGWHVGVVGEGWSARATARRAVIVVCAVSVLWRQRCARVTGDRQQQVRAGSDHEGAGTGAPHAAARTS
jgi:hypothetical protein